MLYDVFKEWICHEFTGWVCSGGVEFTVYGVWWERGARVCVCYVLSVREYAECVCVYLCREGCITISLLRLALRPPFPSSSLRTLPFRVIFSLLFLP